MSDTGTSPTPPPLPPPAMLAVFNQKGGVAKTTTACNLAVCLTALGYRVLLVDLDLQGNASSCFGIATLPAEGAYEVITGRGDIADIALDTPYEGLWLLPATHSLHDNDHLLTPAGRRRGLLEARLADTGVDIVVVDCPPSLSPASATALASATAVLVPACPQAFAHDGLVNSWYEIRRIRETVNYQLDIAGILLTRVEKGPIAAEVATTIRSEFGEQVLPIVIPFDFRVAEADLLGVPVAVVDPDGPAGHASLESSLDLVSRLIRANRHWSTLPPPASMDQALVTLRNWSATLPAERTRPGTEPSPVEPAFSSPPASYSSQRTPVTSSDGETHRMSDGLPPRLVAAFAIAAFFAGIVLDALLGLSAQWLR